MPQINLLPECTTLINNDLEVHCLFVKALAHVHNNNTNSAVYFLNILNMHGAAWMKVGSNGTTKRPQKELFIANFHSTSGVGKCVIRFLLTTQKLGQTKSTQLLRDLKKKIIFYADQSNVQCYYWGHNWATEMSPKFSDVHPAYKSSKSKAVTPLSARGMRFKSEAMYYVQSGLRHVMIENELNILPKDKNGHTEIDKLRQDLHNQEVLSSFYQSKCMRLVGLEPHQFIADPNNKAELTLRRLESGMQNPAGTADVSLELTRRYLNLTFHTATKRVLNYYNNKVSAELHKTKDVRTLINNLKEAMEDEHIQDFESPACKRIRKRDPIYQIIQKDNKIMRSMIKDINN